MIDFLGRKVPQTLQEIAAPQHTIVLVQDSQNDFLHKEGLYRKMGVAEDASRLFSPMQYILNEARKRGVRVMYSVFTNHADGSSYTDPQITKGYPNILDPSKRGVVENTWGWQIFDDVKPIEDERVIKKHRNDTFIGTDLELILRSCGIKTIVHIGISVPNGILTSAWHAFNIGFYPVVPKDAAGAAFQWDEEAGWKVIPRCATITTTKEIVAAWDASK